MTRRTLHAPILILALVGGYLALPTPQWTPDPAIPAAMPSSTDDLGPTLASGNPGQTSTEAPEPSQSGLGFAQRRPQRRETWTPTVPAPQHARVAQRQRQRAESPSSPGSNPGSRTKPSQPIKSPRSGPTDRTQAKYGVPWLVRAGLASHMGSGYPSGYLALPHGPGWLARICGAGDCVVMASNDAGPSLARQRQGRVADLSVAVFEKVCGVPSSLGLCPVSVTILGKAK